MSNVRLGENTTQFVDALATYGENSQKGGTYTIIKNTDKSGSDQYRVAKKVCGLAYVFLCILCLFVDLNAYTTKSTDIDDMKKTAEDAINSDEQNNQNHKFQVELTKQMPESRDSITSKADKLDQISAGLSALGFEDTENIVSTVKNACEAFRERLQEHEDDAETIGLLGEEETLQEVVDARPQSPQTPQTHNLSLPDVFSEKELEGIYHLSLLEFAKLHPLKLDRSHLRTTN